MSGREAKPSVPFQDSRRYIPEYIPALAETISYFLADNGYAAGTRGRAHAVSQSFHGFWLEKVSSGDSKPLNL